MTKDEKRQFKSFVLKSVPKEKNEDRRYLRLFDIINKQEIYNEPELLELVKEIKPRHLPGFKNYLYNNILKSLEQSRSESSVEIVIRRLIYQATILYDKGLYAQCNKILKKALKPAVKYEKELLLAEIYSIKKKLALMQFSPNEEDQIIQEESSIYQKLGDEKEYYWLWLRSAAYLNKQRASRSKPESQNWREQLGNSKYMVENGLAKTFFSKRLFFYLKATDAFIKGDNENTIYYTGELVEHFLKNPHQIAEDPDAYIVALNNHILALVMKKNYSEAKKRLAEFEKIPATFELSPIARAKVFGFYYSNLINIDSELLNLPLASRHISDFDRLLPDHIDHIRKNNLIVIYFNITKLFFSNQNYKKVIYWSHRIDNEFSIEVRGDLQSITRLISIITNYELGNNDLAMSLIRSTRHQLKKHKRLHKFETTVLDFLEKKFPAISDKKSCTNEFTVLRKQLETLSKTEFEKEVFTYFDFITWAESKIKNRPLGEIVRENSKI